MSPQLVEDVEELKRKVNYLMGRDHILDSIEIKNPEEHVLSFDAKVQ